VKTSFILPSFTFSATPRILLSACIILTTAGFALKKDKINRNFVTALCEQSQVDKFAGTSLYPPIQPREKRRLRVSDKHTIAYSLYGNPKGKPVLFVHGGPGGGTDPAVCTISY
jgi:hypothetical protein